MRQTRSPTTMSALALILLVCACGVESRELPIQTAEAAEPSPVLPVEESEPSASTIKEPPPSSTSTADITTTTLKRNNIPAVMERPPVSYLKDTVPPCTPIDQDSPNPCEFGGSSPRTRTSGSHSSERLPDVLPTISEMINELPPTMTPHIVVRATGLPDTTRCDGLYPVRIANFLPEDSWLSNMFRYYCFTDFKINEYIIGDGPPKLTIKHATGRVSLLDPDDVETVDEQWVKETFDLPEPERGSRFQGRELVMILGMSGNISVETWSPQGYYYSMWYITQENNELRAISTAMDRWARTPEHRQQMNRPLDELIQEIKQAIETRATQTGGRIGLDPTLPMLITDANNLQDFYQTVGAVYEGDNATVLPPPLPNQEVTTPTPTDDTETTTTNAAQPQTENTTTTSPTSTTQPAPSPSSAASSPTVSVPEPDDTSITMERPPVSYLEEPIPPCTPINPDGPDPCKSERSPPTRESSSNSSYIALLPDVLPTISEMINELHPIMTPHIVVRATGLPDTTRCDGLYPVQTANFEPEDRSNEFRFHYYCFTDFRINEYIIGSGPPILTIEIAAGNVSLANPNEVETIDEQWMKETFDLPDPESASEWERKELVMMLGVSRIFSVETWTPRGYYYSMWQITRENNELRAISTAMEDWARTPEHRQQMNRPLDELIQEIKQAIETRATQTGGRIGMDLSLPLLITDANNLQDFYQAVGAVYEGDDATVLPPPVPGQEDPKQDPPAATTQPPDNNGNTIPAAES